MEKDAIKDFFDRLAPQWDADILHDEKKIARILDCAEISKGARVLDVACGTGVLIPDYLARGVSQVTGIDLSPEMIRVAREKFIDPRVRLLCGDAEETTLPKRFDRCVIYNALPHFPDPARLIRRLADALLPGGRLTVAHGMSRARINAHHVGSAHAVSLGLPEAEALAECFLPRFAVDVIISDADIYAVSGKLTDN